MNTVSTAVIADSTATLGNIPVPLLSDLEPSTLTDAFLQRLAHLEPWVSATLDHLPSLIPAASVLAIPLFGLIALILFIALRVPRPVRQTILDRAWFERTVLPEPPELIATRLTEALPTAAFERIVERLVQQDDLEIEVLMPATEHTPARVRLRLRTDPETLHPIEQQVVEALFGSAREIRSDLHRARHHEHGFDPAHITDSILFHAAVASDRRQRGRSPIGSQGRNKLLLVLLLGLGTLLGLFDTVVGNQAPYALAGGLVAWIALLALSPRRWWHPGRSAFAGLLWLLPLALATFYGGLLHLLPGPPLGAASSVGLALILISGFLYPLANARGFDRTMAHRYSMLQARRWVQRQLRRTEPDLQDAWLAHLEALGLSRDLARWRRRHGSRTDAADVAAPTGDAFTGVSIAYTGTPRATWSPALHVPVRDTRLDL